MAPSKKADRTFGISGEPPSASQQQRIQDLVSPHVDSFDYFLDEGLRLSVAALEPQEVDHPSGEPGSTIRFWFDSVAIAKPTRTEPGALDIKPLYPNECRERGSSYKASIQAVICRQIGEAEPERFSRKLGLLPIMVRSKKCNLRGMNSAELVHHNEENVECGGYFLCNGNERAIRLLIAPKRNHIMGICRSSFKNRGSDFTQFATTMRCARPDGTSQTVALHLLHSGGAKADAARFEPGTFRLDARRAAATATELVSEGRALGRTPPFAAAHDDL